MASGLVLPLAVLFGATSCHRNSADASPSVAASALGLSNRVAYIPPQCFTRVADDKAEAPQNPCYVCHADAVLPNMQSQPELQLAYQFPQAQAGRDVQNPWSNLFRDRSAQLAEISDAAVRRYVSQDNYGYGARAKPLSERLSQLGPQWDTDGNGRWDGYVPDANFRFDDRGFDRDRDGVATGYRVFAYYPLPGGFLPANGSFDDVLIRLPAAFRSDGAGVSDFAVYELNLAVVEALIRRRDVPIDATDERVHGVDLDGDSVLGVATRVRYRYDARNPAGSLQYLGKAGQLQAVGELPMAPGLFPQGTEFLHSVRYLGVDDQGAVSAAPRMKELRYARKQRWLSYAQLSDGAQREQKEAALNPDRPEQFAGDAERGLNNATGWVFSGFIEDERGELRPQTHEETLFCMGCHGGLSATEDSIFSFARKRSQGPVHGYHSLSWGQGAQIPDPLREDGLPEFATYLRLNHEGDGYRSNVEVRERFFDAQGRPREAAFEELARDVSALLLPSAARALALDKAYWLIVREQSFVAGRDAVIGPMQHVLRTLSPDQPTGITQVQAAPRLQL